MTYEQVENFLENAGYDMGGLTVEEVEVLAGYEGFKYNEKRERFYYSA